MAWKTVQITESRSTAWEGNKGPNKFKTRAHYAMVIVLIIGLLAILAICIWLAVEVINKDDDDDTTTVATATTETMPTEDQRKLAELLKAVGERADGVRVANFTNWDKSVMVSKVFVVSPTTPSEIQLTVKAAVKLGLRVRAVGSAHTYSNLFPDEGQILLETASLWTGAADQITLDDSEAMYNSSTVSALAGITMGELRDFLVDNDLQIPAFPVVSNVQLAGVIGTGAHGNLFMSGPLSDYVLAVQYIDANGDLQLTSNQEDVKRLRLCLGLCGIMYRITLKVEPVKTMTIVQSFLDGETLIKNSTHLRGLLEDKQGLELFYAPLSSLTDEQWDTYATEQSIAYTPWQDLWWYRIFDDADDAVAAPDRGRRRRSVAYHGSLWSGILPGSLADSDDSITPAPPVPILKLVHKAAYDATLALTEANPNMTGLYPDLAVHVDSSDLATTNSISFVFPETEEYGTLERVMNITFAVSGEYLSRDEPELPYLTVEIRWNAVSEDCVLCPGAYSTASRVLFVEFISAPWKPNFHEFLSKVLGQLREEFPNLRVEWPKFNEGVNGLRDLLVSSMEQQLMVMSQASTDQVGFKDIFSTQLLRELYTK